MIVRFQRGNMTETRPVQGKLDHHVSARRKRVTDISNFPFPSSLQNTETRYFVLPACGSFFPPFSGSYLGFLFLSAQLALHFSTFVGRNSKPLYPPDHVRWLLLSLLSSSKSFASFSAIWI